MHLSLLMAVSAGLSGAVVGFFLALFGGGGSMMATPLLLYVVGVRDPHVAIGTSAASVALNAATNLIGHWRGGRVLWRCAGLFAGAGLVGSVVGSSIAKAIESQRLLVYFAAAMAVVALLMFRRPAREVGPGAPMTWAVALKLAPLGLLTGLAAGFFGIGGGFLIVPALMAATGMPIANAAACSLVSVALFSATTAANYALSGLVDLPLTGIFVVGGAAGGWLGLRASKLLVARALLARRLFAALVLVMAAYVAWRAMNM
jgi:hypothetical protein